MSKKLRKRDKYYIADLETTTDTGRVWNISLVEVDNDYETLADVEGVCANLNYKEKNSKRRNSKINVFTNINDFMDYVSKLSFSATIFFHNLKFDGLALINWLERNDYTFKTNSENLEVGEYFSLISSRGDFFTLEVCVSKINKGTNKDGTPKYSYKKIKFRDSLKLLPFKVSQLSENFCPGLKKMDTEEFGLKKENDVIDYIPTFKEMLYCVVDSVIVSKALNYLLNFKTDDDTYIDFDKITLSSVAYDNFKYFFCVDHLGEHALNYKLRNDHFRKAFPALTDECKFVFDENINEDGTITYSEVTVDDYIKRAYHGGIVYLNPKLANKEIKTVSYDVNSLYPSVMKCEHGEKMPYGVPHEFEGDYKDNKFLHRTHKLYIQTFKANLVLKEGKIPFLKNPNSFVASENLINTFEDEEKFDTRVTLTLSNVDIENMYLMYDVYDYEPLHGVAFKCSDKIFKNYINYWYTNRLIAKNNGNKSLELISKMMLNSISGKFAQGTLRINKQVTGQNDEDGVIKFKNHESDTIEPIYSAISVFITSYGRQKLLNAISDNVDKFVYCDTDSITLKIDNIEDLDKINILEDNNKLGFWKFEGLSLQSRYVKAKTYINKKVTQNAKILTDKDKIKELVSLDCYDLIPVVKCSGLPTDISLEIPFDKFVKGAKFEKKIAKQSQYGRVLMPIEFQL